LRPGIFIFWQNDGPITREDRLNNIKMIGTEVMPAVREMGKELGLQSPFEVQPGLRPLPASGKPESVGSLEERRPRQEFRRRLVPVGGASAVLTQRCALREPSHRQQARRDPLTDKPPALSGSTRHRGLPGPAARQAPRSPPIRGRVTIDRLPAAGGRQR